MLRCDNKRWLGKQRVASIRQVAYASSDAAAEQCGLNGEPESA